MVARIKNGIIKAPPTAITNDEQSIMASMASIRNNIKERGVKITARNRRSPSMAVSPESSQNIQISTANFTTVKEPKKSTHFLMKFATL